MVEIMSSTSGQTSQPGWAWHEIGKELTSRELWSHSGIAIMSQGTVVVSTPGDSSLSLIHEDDSITNLPLGNGIYHGIALDVLDIEDFLWLADIGVEPTDGKLLGYSFAKEKLMDFSPDVEKMPEVLGWRPTSVAVERSISDPQGQSLWVADGYGNSLVHRLSANEPLTIDGSKSGTKFDCPHGIALDDRHPQPLLVVADRSNERLVWFDLNGNFVRELKHELITSPSSIAISGQNLYFTELHGGLVSVSQQDRVEDVLPRSTRSRDGAWPNEVSAGVSIRPSLTDGLLNSPHGITASKSGSLFFTEWIIGGRTIRLDPYES